ncbi:hypothetical protein DICPUDRAFT_78565 [Dictyostelium purpureum]|uniref:Transmembrane protein n=1 Tax=Dictyostelium purpureum TaxID=5786 RepID=F0ZJX6_DICPU|nr:uncharacterized protein DICPUDRAFT_78565 [Dictyostelium purpureum]EGC35758.1 hypothetical protein DICPUDRAFT_78565 [Dictyostelium purpureum]|eukprot:XP_003287710.1 hypothetical protein DICPUDRAFT_78565 [Dictyostelium purpureum]
MNILKSLLFSILSISLLKSTSSYILYEQYNYMGICPGEPPVNPQCEMGENYFGAILYQESQCVTYNLTSVIFTTKQDTIFETIYDDSSCKGNIFNIVEHTSGSCESSCVLGYGNTFKLSILENYEVPSDTYLSVTYSGECNGDFDKDFLQIDYQYVDKCTNIGFGIYSNSQSVSCNKTTTTVSTFSKPGCTGGIYHESHYENQDNCKFDGGSLNYIDICNI